MPNDGHPGDHGTELLEMRVLDGPNRFFSRPAIKIEFTDSTPGAAGEAAERAAAAVRELHEAIDLRPPRTTRRHSEDGTRALVAFQWRRRTISQAIGAAAARIALGRSSRRREVAALRATALGPLPHLPEATVPIVAVTGTNGKSTTTRLLAHILASAGRRVGMTNSDGIYVDGELVEAGDWTGFGGAASVLAERGLDLAVLETARGGILLRGIGYERNDVAVVTNVSAGPSRAAGNRHPRRAGGDRRARSCGSRGAMAGPCSTPTTRGSGACGGRRRRAGTRSAGSDLAGDRGWRSIAVVARPC